MQRLSSLLDLKIVFAIFITTASIAIFLSCFIIFVIFSAKTIHSPANLLVCNTCLATICYLIASTISICVFYMETALTDWSCRILAYWNYTFLTMVSSSYAVQGISRLLFIFFHNHRRFFNYKCHIAFIISQVLISLFVSLPSLITKDIVFRPLHLCLIPATKAIHLGYFFAVTYFTPFSIVIIIYGLIYCRVVRSSITSRHSLHLTKRDLELTRNILILLVIFLIAGIPSIIYMIVSKTTSISRALYMFTVGATAIAAMCEKICLLCLNREIWKETGKFTSKLHPARPIG